MQARSRNGAGRAANGGEAMAAGRRVSRVFFWIIMALLFVGLIGFGATGLSGNVRTLGRVGEKEIPVQRYAQELTRQIRAFEAQTGEPLSFPQAEAFGLDQMVLGQIVATRALDNEVAELGVSVGDARVAQTVLAEPGFRGIDGSFDREAYRFALENAGLTEAEFEQSIREDIARSLLQGAVVSGIPAPAAYADAVVEFIATRRDVTWATLAPEDLPAPPPAPTEAEIAAHYEADPDAWTTPETREITYAWLTPQMIAADMPVDEAMLRELYQDRIDEFVQPERRLVERLVMRDPAAAEEALARIGAGEIDFDGLVEERGLELVDIDLGDVAQDELGAGGEAVFAARPGEVVGPFETSVGPALFRMKAVLAAEETSFEEAAPSLREELAAARARRAIEEGLDEIEDLIAGGATIEDLAERTDLELGTIAWEPEVREGIAAYDAFRNVAAALTEGGFPEPTELEDGGVFVARLDALRPPERRPLEEVREAVAADWRAEALQRALVAEAERRAAELSGGAGFEDLGLDPQREEGLTRRSFVPGTPQGFAEQVFAMEPGEVRVVPGEGRAVVARLDAVAPPATDDPGVEAEREAVADRAAAGIAQDIFSIFSREVQERTEVRIDDAAVNAVHSQFR